MVVARPRVRLWPLHGRARSVRDGVCGDRHQPVADDRARTLYVSAGRGLGKHPGLSDGRHSRCPARDPVLYGLVVLGVSRQGARRQRLSLILEDQMRGLGTALFTGCAIVWSAGMAEAAELRVVSVGSVQIAAKSLAADFIEATGSPVLFTIVAPSEISQKLAG